MRRLRSSLLLVVLTVAALAERGDPLLNPRVRQVGEHFGCQCGCGATVTSCNMIRCHYADPARKKIADMVDAGKSDDEIKQSFIKEEGLKVVLEPPKEGAYLAAWVMPFIGLALGGGVVLLMLQKLRQPKPAPAGPVRPPMDEATLARYRERIEKELGDE